MNFFTKRLKCRELARCSFGHQADFLRDLLAQAGIDATVEYYKRDARTFAPSLKKLANFDHAACEARLTCRKEDFMRAQAFLVDALYGETPRAGEGLVGNVWINKTCACCGHSCVEDVQPKSMSLIPDVPHVVVTGVLAYFWGESWLEMLGAFVFILATETIGIYILNSLRSRMATCQACNRKRSAWLPLLRMYVTD